MPTRARGLVTAALGRDPIAVTEDGAGVALHLTRRLTDLGYQATVVETVPPDSRAVIFLGGLREVSSPQQAHAVNREAFAVARRLSACDPGLFVAVQDTGGDFGLHGSNALRARLGGVCALARTAALEWPQASVKAIDCERGERDAAEVAEAVCRELLEGGADKQVGLSADGTRSVLRAVEAPRTDADVLATSLDGSVIVATGGARGVTAHALLALAQRASIRILLLGRTRLVEEPAHLHGAYDEAELKRSLIRNNPGTPLAAIGAKARQVTAVREIRTTLASLAAAGAEARYTAVDATDAEALCTVLARTRSDWGPITGIVHGAGVLADKLIADKTDEQFSTVFDTKVLGLENLLAATEDDPLRFLCLFSSIAAWSGNAGQCDYAIANEVLNQIACAERARRPHASVRSLMWGPWRGGMVDAALERRFEEAGIALIDREPGAGAFAGELAAQHDEVEVILVPHGAGNSLGAGSGSRQAQIPLSADSHPHLVDHTIEQSPVVPLAMVLDWFARLIDESPEPVLSEVEVVRGVTLDGFDAERRVLTVAGFQAPDGSRLRISDPDGTLRYRATVRPPVSAPDEPPREPDGSLEPVSVPVYDGRILFHGPRFRALSGTVTVSDSGAAAVLAGVRELGWPDEPWATDPAAIDGALQLAGLWAARVLGHPTLPMSIGEFRRHGPGPADARYPCVLSARAASGDEARCDLVLSADGRVRAELIDVLLIRRPR